jgi:hypothetical protein
MQVKYLKIFSRVSGFKIFPKEYQGGVERKEKKI